MGIIKEGIKWYVVIIILMLAVFGIAVILQFAGYAVMPTFLKQERTIYKSSYQYTEAKQTELLNLVTQYNDLETKKQEYLTSNNGSYSGLVDNIETQQKALSDQIHNEADLVQDQSELPKSVRQFLLEHPR